MFNNWNQPQMNSFGAPQSTGWQMPDFGQPLTAQGMNQAYQAQPLQTSLSGPAGVGGTGGMFSNMDWGDVGTGIQGLNALAQGWLGMEQLSLAKDNFAFQKDAFKKNYESQKKLTNQSIADRQAARYAANPNAYASPNEQWKSDNLI